MGLKPGWAARLIGPRGFAVLCSLCLWGHSGSLKDRLPPASPPAHSLLMVQDIVNSGGTLASRAPHIVACVQYPVRAWVEGNCWLVGMPPTIQLLYSWCAPLLQ